MHERNPQNPGLEGQTLDGRYEVHALIGSGAMGQVYRAHQLAVGRDVAIKVMHPHAGNDETWAARFETEVRAIAGLTHPNSLRLFDVGHLTDGRLYVVTELLEGRSLSEALKDGPMTPLLVVRILSQVAQALAEAHLKGIVHRDLKPHNLFLQAHEGQETVKILDFGIAKLLEDGTLTAKGSVLGTPAYMSPEQAEGLPIDERSDLYSLGLIGYRCLAGRDVFSAQSPLALMAMHVNDRPTPLSQHSQVPPPLEHLVDKLLEKKPEDRYANASALLDDLEALEHQLAHETQNPGGPQSNFSEWTETIPPNLDPWPRRPTWPRIRTAALIAGLALITFLGFRMLTQNAQKKFTPPRQTAHQEPFAPPRPPTSREQSMPKKQITPQRQAPPQGRSRSQHPLAPREKFTPEENATRPKKKPAPNHRKRRVRKAPKSQKWAHERQKEAPTKPDKKINKDRRGGLPDFNLDD